MSESTSSATARSRPRVPAERPGWSWRRDLIVVPLAFVLDLLLSGVWDTGLLVRPGSGEPVPLVVVIVIVAVMAGLLLLRRRYPLPVLAATVALSALLAFLLVPAQPVVCVMVALYAAASRGSWQRTLAALGLALIQVVLVVWVVARSYQMPTAMDVVFPALLFTVLVLAVWGCARHDRAIHQRARRWGSELDALAEEAALAERHRIARELHDILAHSVSAMMMQAAGARAVTQSVGRQASADPRLRSVQDALTTIESTGSQSMRELHRLLSALRDDKAQDGGNSLDLEANVLRSEQPGLCQLDTLIEVPRRSGLIVELHRSGTPGTMDPSVDAAAYRVVQEALTNALKHAGRGAVVDVYEAWQDDQVQVQVRCRAIQDAARPSTPNGGTGLRGLRERVELAGGTFDAGWAGADFVTTATLPTRPSRPHPSQVDRQ